MYFGFELLWPWRKIETINKKFETLIETQHIQDLNTLSKIKAKWASEKLESSYAGSLGKLIEPGIKPLGFDWKIGISLITSFAAREVLLEQWQPFTATALMR